MQEEHHFINRSNWLRASVLGANDGILSTASIAIGVSAATDIRTTVILGAVAGLVAGAFSMAAGEYVSVSSQSDIENSDLKREAHELEVHPEEELDELAEIYENRGLTKSLAKEVAIQLTAHNALEAHARDELGINEITAAQPLTAALASGLAFTVGGTLPVLVALLAPMGSMMMAQYFFAILFLALLGALSASTGGAGITKAVLRITFWGTLAMVATAIVGHLFNVNMH